MRFGHDAEVAMIFEGIDFIPYKWDFANGDGEWGHIYFFVESGLFEYGANNGAYVRQNKCENEIEKRYAGKDIMSMATSCLDFNPGSLPLKIFGEILTAAIKQISLNFWHCHRASKCPLKKHGG